MTFDLSNNYDVNKAEIKFKALIASGKKIELKEIKHCRETRFRGGTRHYR